MVAGGWVLARRSVSRTSAKVSPAHGTLTVRALLALAACFFIRAPADASEPCQSDFPFGPPVEIAVPTGDRVSLCQRSRDGSIEFFSSRYDRSRVAADWTAYRLTRDRLLLGAANEIVRDQQGVLFAPDPLIETQGFKSPSHASFNGIGNLRPPFDRGHLLPAEAFKWNLEAYQRTFIVSNIAVQAAWFNQQLWQDVEAQVRGWACEHRSVFVVTGVIHGFGQSTFPLRGRQDVSWIPTHFYTLAYSPTDGGHAVAIVFPNFTPEPDERSIAVKAGVVTVDALEAMTGLDFFPEMPAAEQSRIESEGADVLAWHFDVPRRFQCAA